MPENRPHIPAEIEREIMIECGRRCSVCGAPTPLERAHIIPWHKSHEHNAEDLVCLCANCHERSHRENWGERNFGNTRKIPGYYEFRIGLILIKSKKLKSLLIWNWTITTKPLQGGFKVV